MGKIVFPGKRTLIGKPILNGWALNTDIQEIFYRFNRLYLAINDMNEIAIDNYWSHEFEREQEGYMRQFGERKGKGKMM